MRYILWSGLFFGPAFIYAGCVRLRMWKQQGMVALLVGSLGIAVGLGFLAGMGWLIWKMQQEWGLGLWASRMAHWCHGG